MDLIYTYDDNGQIYPTFAFNLVLNTSSIVGGLIVVITSIVMMLKKERLLDRVSIRLSTMISLNDIIRSGVIIFYNKYEESGAICEATAISLTFLTLVYIFLYIFMAFNSQLIIIHDKELSPKREYFYWGITIAFSFILAILPYGELLFIIQRKKNLII
ncbi:hypothetical protein K502DRAFT_294807 [Neoconidiobolus thromboides FSU 785]|nr:hypothetical protein K502DRAFT_294807 [Neoconidiobolus thromboides FSU 785]